MDEAEVRDRRTNGQVNCGGADLAIDEFDDDGAPEHGGDDEAVAERDGHEQFGQSPALRVEQAWKRSGGTRSGC